MKGSESMREEDGDEGWVEGGGGRGRRRSKDHMSSHTYVSIMSSKWGAENKERRERERESADNRHRKSRKERKN